MTSGWRGNEKLRVQDAGRYATWCSRAEAVRGNEVYSVVGYDNDRTNKHSQQRCIIVTARDRYTYVLDSSLVYQSFTALRSLQYSYPFFPR